MDKYVSNEKFINPFIIYAYSWIIVFLVYLLGWSNSYPKLGLGVVAFLIVTSVISIWLSRSNSRKFNCSKVNFEGFNIKVYNKVLIILYILLGLEFIVGGIPVVMYNSEFTDDSLYMEWGIPIVNVIVVNGFGAMFQIAVTLFCFNVISKSAAIRNMFLTILPPIICVQRGIAMNMFVGAFCIFLLTSKKLKRNVITIGVVGLLILYLFGVVVRIILLKRYNKSFKDNIGGVLLFDLFVFSWLPINFICLFIKSCNWDSIKHNRSVDIENV